MDVVEECLSRALHLESVGRWSEAEEICRKAAADYPANASVALILGLILHRSRRQDEGLNWIVKSVTINPDFVDGWHYLAATMAAMGRRQETIACLRQAIRLKPDNVDYRCDLANLLAHQGELAEAAEHYRQALAHRPDHSDAAYYLGNALSALGRLDEAARAYADALRIRPDFVEARINRANALHRLGCYDEAAAEARQVIALRPDLPEAHNNLGAALKEMGDFEAAADACRQAVALRPDYANAHNNMGMALHASGRHEEAIETYRNAIALAPNLASAHTNLGQALYALGRMEEALAASRKAVDLDPNSSDAHNNLAVALEAVGRQEEAVAAYRGAIALAPERPEIHFHYGMTLLKLGRLGEGWAEYEWRRKIEKFRREVPGDEWNGASLDGKTILLYGEQGLGDVLQFVRYAPLIAAKGARVVLWVDGPLARIAGTVPGVSDVVAYADPLPAYDCHLPLMSAPCLLGTTLDTIPAEIPYLFVDDVAASAWGERLAGMPGLKVGLVWAGNPRRNDSDASHVDRRRSLSPKQLAPLAGMAGITFVSLQKGDAALPAAPEFPLIDWMDEIADFADTAALVANLDLVIAVDTSVAHLAGALGKPVWILSRFDGCWRWLKDRDDSPWYPTARLFRQEKPGDWQEVIGRMAAELGKLAQSRQS